jgi:hypothetical protein
MRAHVIGPALLALVPAATPAQEPVQEDGADRPEFWRLVERLVDDADARPAFDQVLEHLRGVPVVRATLGQRLPRVDQGLTQPWTVPALASELQELLAHPATVSRDERFPGCAAGIADWLSLERFEVASPTCEHPGLAELHDQWKRIADPAVEGLDLLAALSSFLEIAHLVLEESLAGLDEAQRATLFEGTAGFLEAWYRDHFPDTEHPEAEKQALAAFQELLARAPHDRALQLGVADALLRLAEPDFLATLQKRLGSVKEEVDTKTFGRDTLAVVGDSPRNRVILSGRRASTHSQPAALLIDLGGKDTYERAAVVDSPDALVSVVLDLAGDDTYEGEGPGPAAAVGGAALLVDRLGDDRYASTRFGQSATALGFAALVDLAGDDVHLAEDYTQGFAAGGVSLLFDLEGKDTYTAWAYAQGAGIGVGLSALVDGEGDDRYLADEHWPDVYGDSGPDIHHGASQGYSTGIREDVPGGIAALIDLGDGEDRYQAGSFSAGGGYYFSFGLMVDGGGDDQNLCSRYGQGFGVHQAIGVRWDHGGDDTYTGRSVAHTGMGWDEGVGYLLEDGGDDTYATGTLCCGGAAQTAVAICLDLEGADTYPTASASLGGTGGSEYHDKPSIGVLLDLGGQKDRYPGEGRADGEVRVTAGVEVFLDTSAKTVEQALRKTDRR